MHINAVAFVEKLYRMFPGRVPVAVAGNMRVGNVYPLVYSRDVDGPVALIACLPRALDAGGTIVEVAHVSTLKPDVSPEDVRDWIAREAESSGISLEFGASPPSRAPQNWVGDERPGPRFVRELQQIYSWRVPISVGLTVPGGHLFPAVVSDAAGRAVGLVACAWNEGADVDLVQVYHVSVFQKRLGHGTYLLERLCALADTCHTRLYVQAQPQFDETNDDIPQDVLTRWYRDFGFTGPGPAMIRPPRNAAPNSVEGELGVRDRR